MAERPTPEYLREALSYDPETGLLVWKKRPLAHFKKANVGQAWNQRYAGKPAFTRPDKDGYLTGCINDWPYQAHRVIFAMIHGRWAIEVDNRDTDRSNNRQDNLREATTTQNRQNERPRGNRSGRKGVYVKTTRQGKPKIEASIQVSGKAHYLGTFATVDEAAAAYHAAALQHFGEFARIDAPSGGGG